MSDARPILGPDVRVIAAGVELFAGEVERQGVTVERVGWQPPVAGSARLLARLAAHTQEIARANDTATERMRSAHPLLVGVGRASELLPDLETVQSRLRWMRDVLARVMAATLQRLAPIDLRFLIAQALQMGDEGHNRNRAGTSLLLREILPALLELDEPAGDLADVARFIAGNDHFFLNLTMPAGVEAFLGAVEGLAEAMDR